MRYQEAKGVSAATLQKEASHLNIFCGWIGKGNMMGDPRDLLVDPARFGRQCVTNQDKTDTAPGATVPWQIMLDRIREKDKRIAAQYGLMKPFGLRFEECLKAHPVRDDKGEYLIVEAGAKNGRYREVPITSNEQRQALEELKPFAITKNGSCIPKEYSYIRWHNRARSLNRRVGFTKKGCGYTPHSLRHAFANEQFAIYSGVVSRVKGGNLSEINKSTDQLARMRLSPVMGHNRPQATNCYLGSGK